MIHCVKSVPRRSFSWSVFSCIWTEYSNNMADIYKKIEDFNLIKKK